MSGMLNKLEQEMRNKYKSRLESGKGRNYDLRPENVQMWQDIDLGIASLVADSKMEALRVLVVGCGYGAELYNLLRIGVAKENIHCVDILPERIADVKLNFPTLGSVEAGRFDPKLYASCFDLILCNTVLSSISREADRAELVSELSLVMSNDSKLVIVDLAYSNPWNKDVSAVNMKRILAGTKLELISKTKVTLFPQLSRRIQFRFPGLRKILALFPFFRVSNFHVITKT
jgi:SAM-dependent methyltransferase